MKGGLQNTLFGIWKLGTEQQQRPIALEKKYTCSFCHAGFGNVGALQLHENAVHRAHYHYKELALSSAALQQVAWLKAYEVRVRQETLEKNVEGERETQIDSLSVLTEPEAVEARPKQRRIRRDVKFKARVILLLLQKTLDELTEHAEEKGLFPPSLKGCHNKGEGIGYCRARK